MVNPPRSRCISLYLPISPRSRAPYGAPHTHTRTPNLTLTLTLTLTVTLTLTLRSRWRRRRRPPYASGPLSRGWQERRGRQAGAMEEAEEAEGAAEAAEAEEVGGLRVRRVSGGVW